MEDRPHWTPEGVRVLERTNGTAEPPSARPNPLKRERWVDMGDLYPGHQLLMRFNPNKKGFVPLPDDASQDDKIIHGLQQVVLQHRIHFDDGTPDSPWIDPETDQPLAQPSSPEFWAAISNDILAAIMAQVAVDQKKVQTSIEKTSGLSIEALQAIGPGFPSGTSDA